MPSLTSLSLKGCDWFDPYFDLAIVRLPNLSFYECGCTAGAQVFPDTVAEAVGVLPGIRQLRIFGGLSLSQYVALPALSQLQNICASIGPELTATDIHALWQARSVTHLTLSDSILPVGSLNGLQSLTLLEELDVTDGMDLRDLEYVLRCPGLKAIQVSDRLQVSSLADYHRLNELFATMPPLSRLRVLKLSCVAFPTLPNWLARCRNLRVITLSHVSPRCMGPLSRYPMPEPYASTPVEIMYPIAPEALQRLSQQLPMLLSLRCSTAGYLNPPMSYRRLDESLPFSMTVRTYPDTI